MVESLRAFAFKQLERAGAVLTTSENVIFSLVAGRDHPKFKEVSRSLADDETGAETQMLKIVIDKAPDTGIPIVAF